MTCCRRNQIGAVACCQHHGAHNVSNAILWLGDVLNFAIHHMTNVVNGGGERTCHTCHIAAWLKGTAVVQLNSVRGAVDEIHFKSHLIRVVGNFYVSKMLSFNYVAKVVQINDISKNFVLILVNGGNNLPKDNGVTISQSNVQNTHVFAVMNCGLYPLGQCLAAHNVTLAVALFVAAYLDTALV